MPDIRIIAVGKDRERWVTEGCAHFQRMLSRFVTVVWDIVPTPRGMASLSGREAMKSEARRLLPKFDKGIYIALTERGRSMDSRSFARWLEHLHATSGRTVTFVIGGPYGLAEEVLKRADYSLSLSSLTFSHQLVRVVLLEQLYRAYSILHGTDYHK